jgi:hypothetical protein
MTSETHVIEKPITIPANTLEFVEAFKFELPNFEMKVYEYTISCITEAFENENVVVAVALNDSRERKMEISEQKYNCGPHILEAGGVKSQNLGQKPWPLASDHVFQCLMKNTGHVEIKVEVVIFCEFIKKR